MLCDFIMFSLPMPTYRKLTLTVVPWNQFWYSCPNNHIHTYIPLTLIPEGVAEVSQIFLRDTCVLPILVSYKEHCRRDTCQAHRRLIAVYLRQTQRIYNNKHTTPHYELFRIWHGLNILFSVKMCAWWILLWYLY
jgi:hypothetical protein